MYKRQSQWADVSGGINYSAGNTGVGVADPTYGITYAPSKVLGVTGDGSAAITSKGVLTLANNRATPSATDILGNIDWISQGNGGTANSQIASRIWVTNAGGGGGNGFGSNMSFYTKGDNVATLAERVRIDYTGSMTIGAANADANAVLDVASTTKGLLLPRVPAATLTAMTTPTNGLIAYDSTNHVIKLRANGAWVSLSTSSGAGGGGNTMVTGWPDAIRCSTTSYGTRSLYLAGSPAADGNYYYVDPVYNSQTLTVGFTSAGAYNAAVLGPNMGTTDCNVSIVALYTAGKAFNFIGNTSSAAAGAANEIQFREGGNLQADASFVYDNVNDRVGLGAAVPVSKLHLTTAARTTAFDAANGATWHDLVIQNPTQDLNAATGIALELHGTYNANGATGIAAVKAVDGTDRGSDMVFITRPQAAASAERMRITSAGNVGIGVSTIGANNKLHIRGGTALSGAAINAQSLLVLEGGTDYGNGNVNMHILSSSTKNAQIVFGNEVSSAPGVISYQNAINELAFTANSVATLRLGGTGNVGIGAAPGVDATYPKLQVGGAIVSTVNNAAAATAINFASSNVAYTTAACGAFTLTNMADGGSYSLIVKGSGTGPATFTHTGLTVKTPGTLTCTSAKHTVFSFIRAGTDVYVTMITGY